MVQIPRDKDCWLPSALTSTIASNQSFCPSQLIVKKNTHSSEAGGLTPKPETSENSWELQGTLIDKSSSKILHTYTETNIHPRANKFQSKTYHANFGQLKDRLPKAITNPQTPKTHYWTLHCTPDRRDTAPPTKTPMQAPLTRKP